MGMKIVIINLLLSLLVCSGAYSQKREQTKRERQLERRFRNFCKYVKNKDFEEINQQKLFTKYVAHYTFPGDTSRVIDPRRKEMFTKLLENLDNVLDTINVSEYKAIPWKKFAYPQQLPKMLWESKPVTQLFGQSLRQEEIDQSQRIEKGKKQLDNILVVYKKDMPEVPKYFVLFNKDDKIVSWYLINQGGLHYFLPF